ncbi:MAG: hypothetical protein WD075_09000 [Rhodospirillales bacterium]
MDDLVLDLLQWLKDAPKPYTEVMEAWRTSCPRLTVWEDAIDAGYLEKRLIGATLMVAITGHGLRHLASRRPAAA